MPSSRPLREAEAPQLFAEYFHPEFGYLAPKPALRDKARLVFKGTVFGAIIGGLAAIALAPPRDPAPVVQSAYAMPSSAPSIAAGDRWHMTQPNVLYLAPTLAMPAVTAVPPRAGAAASLRGQAAPPQLPTEASPPARPQSSLTAATKPKKKVVRQPRRERDGATESDPRSAYAGSVRRFAEPQRDWQDRRQYFWNW